MARDVHARLVSVTETVTLPAKGTNVLSFSRLIPLGGDGWTSPRSMYEVQVVLTNDSSTGTEIIKLVLDANYMQVINTIGYAKVGAAADVPLLIDVALTPIAVTLDRVVSGALTSAAGVYCPPLRPLVVPEGVAQFEVATTTTNVDGDTGILDVQIFNFWKRAAEQTPIEIILGSLPRGVTFAGGLA